MSTTYDLRKIKSRMNILNFNTLFESVKRHIKSLALMPVLVLFTLIGNQAFAQINIDQTMTPEELVQDILLGEGITVSNVTFNGQGGDILNNQIGLYEGPSNFIDFDEGIIMASGDVIQAEGGFGGGVDPNITGDPDLYALANEGGTNFSVNNCAILEFDFIPAGDSLSIRFVFTSQEYPSFTCSSYNDPFGFFISGPGLNTGPYTGGAFNIATIPGTDTPIAVNTINSGTPSGFNPASNCLDVNPNFVEDSQYFVDNNPEEPGDIQFPGMTVTLVAEAAVQCGETYHIKLAIADASDGALDSGVFLEKGGFTSNAVVDVLVNPVFDGLELEEGSFDDGLIAGCTDAQFCLYRQDTTGIDTTYFSIGGNAEAGTQYVIPQDTMVIFPAGVDTVCIDIITIANDLGAQVDSLTITTISFNNCGDTILNTAAIDVYNEYSYEVSTTDVTIDCPTDMVELSGSAFGGLPPYTYEWTLMDSTTVIGNGTTTGVEPPPPGETDTYLLIVTDACGLASEYQSVSVTSNVQPDPIADITPPADTINCVGQTVDLLVEGSFGLGEYEYQWSNGDNSPETNVTPDGSQEITWYFATITDECGISSTDSVAVYFIPLEAPTALPGDDITVICAGDSVTLMGDAEGGAEPYEYQWQTSPEPGAEFTVSPSATTTYFLQVTDNCGGTSELAEVDVIVPIYDPITIDLPEPTSNCPGDQQTLTANVTGGAGGFEYEWEGPGGLEEFTPSITVNPVSSSPYIVTVTDICGAAATENTVVTVIIPEDIVATTSAKPNCKGSSIALSVSDITGGAGDPDDFVYQWIGPGIGEDEGITSNGNYTVSGNNIAGEEEELVYILNIIDVCGNTGEGIVQTNFSSVGDIPNVITPNNDGINDDFIIANSSIFNTDLTIMDRWGKVVFESDNYICDRTLLNDPSTLINSNCWDASDKQGEVYYYILDIDNGLCTYQGVVHVLDNQ